MFLLGLFIGYFSIIDAQWRIRYEYLFSNVNFQERIRTDQMNYPFVHFTSSFMIPTQFDRTANFISCTNPETSYITLNSQYPQVQQYYCEIRKHFYSSSYYYDHYQSSFLKGFLSFDLYFQGTWTNGKVTFSIDLFTGEYLYNSPSTYALNSQFCDEIAYDIRTVNFTIPYNVNGDFLFGIQNTNENGQVSIRNIYQMYYEIICYPSCKSCTGPKQNECTACYFGTPTNNVCLPCPSDQYYVKNVGCRLKCDSIQPLCFNGFCNACPSNFQLGYVIVNQKISNDPNSYKDFLQWSKIYDPKFIDNSVDVFHYTKNGQNILLYGIFKQSSGIMRQVSISNVWGYYMKVKIMIIIFNGFPMDCGIQFKFMESSFFYFIFLMQLQQKTYEFDNNTLVGSIYKNSSGIQLHKFKEFQETSLGPYESYSSSYKYIIDGVFDLPKYTILFSAIGNFSDTSFGWAFQSIWFGTQRCTNNCQACDVQIGQHELFINFKCTYCSSQTFRYRDGTCISTCNQPHQNIISDYCKDLDDETPYSQLLIREDVNHFELDYNFSQRGQNFLKGPDIYFSYLKGLRIFGGQFIWAQARFRRVHQNLGPHHSISIGFYVFFGPLFPSDGKFIYQIDQQDPLYTSTLNAVTFQNGTKQQIIRKKINHSLNHLILELECFGENNEVQQAYCGFYNYYLAIHYCQPFCLQCTDEKTCTNWNSTYNPSLIQFSQDECQTNQYFDVYQLLCVNCEPSCSTCKSKTVCLTCINPTYTLTKVGCFCKLNQIEESNQCVNCPIECNQCSSSSYCTECLSINNRKLLNGQCICIDGYYQKDQDIICSLCDKFCGIVNLYQNQLIMIYLYLFWSNFQ